MKKVDMMLTDVLGFMHLRKNGATWSQKCPFADGNVVCGIWCIHFGEVQKVNASGLAPVHMIQDPGSDYKWKRELTCGCGTTIFAKSIGESQEPDNGKEVQA